jgi:Phage derived protein Gp49-like (DUF891)
MERATRLKKIPAAFYQSGGREPVREWLKALDAEDRKVIGEDIATVEYGWPIGMPTCRPLGQGLWEVRSTLRNNRIARDLRDRTEPDGTIARVHKENTANAG